MQCNNTYFWSATQQMSLCVPALVDMVQFPITLSGQLHQEHGYSQIQASTLSTSEREREREMRKGLEN